MGKQDLGRPYWLPASVPLTSAASEIKFGQTPEAKGNLDVVAAVTNMTLPTFKLRDLGGAQIIARDYEPLFTLFGKRDSARHPYYWPRSFPLEFTNRLEVEVKNDAVAPEAAGHVIFTAIPREAPQMQIEGLEQLGTPDIITFDPTFTGSAADLITKETAAQDEDFVIHGAYTDLASAQLMITGAWGEQFMSDWTPIWGVASRSASQLSPLLWPRKYFLPKNATMTIMLKNPGAEAAALKLYFVGQRLPAGWAQ
jgi:hypothetical protein